MISRFSAWVLVVAGVFNVVIWPRFARAIVADERAWSGAAWDSAPTSFLWVHAALIGTAMTLGVWVLVIGIRAVAGSRRTR
ncbi:SCO4848 family membrane protein [Aeromicrobium sp. CTD01-1L150]|uniref:SCO4848 family membrane protein n=1 Tax=Aeromicrobium sp. CTD01-1L150 TaxID=3341830 RepID=UPI0035C1793C